MWSRFPDVAPRWSCWECPWCGSCEKEANSRHHKQTPYCLHALGLRPSETERVSRRFVCFMYMACKRPIQCSGPCWENFYRFLCSFNFTSMWLQRMCRYDLRRCSERTPSSCSSVRNSACEKLSSTSSCRWPCGSFFLLLLFLVTSLLEQLVSPGKGGQKRYSERKVVKAGGDGQGRGLLSEQWPCGSAAR